MKNKNNGSFWRIKFSCERLRKSSSVNLVYYNQMLFFHTESTLLYIRYDLFIVFYDKIMQAIDLFFIEQETGT